MFIHVFIVATETCICDQNRFIDNTVLVYQLVMGFFLGRNLSVQDAEWDESVTGSQPDPDNNDVEEDEDESDSDDSEDEESDNDDDGNDDDETDADSGYDDEPDEADVQALYNLAFVLEEDNE